MACAFNPSRASGSNDSTIDNRQYSMGNAPELSALSGIQDQAKKTFD
jgi:hypothetical protein